ncbi:MAG: hypothetical protein H7175_02935 [Burkholderiales bacterium]|nr:hypothetical protein [Anaerolineae bacterium]
MNPVVQRFLPVVISIAIIIVVAILRDYSKTLAAITATLPVNLPLALWIVATGPNATPEDTVKFSQTLLLGIFSTVLYVVAVWLAMRAGWTLFAAIGAGYVAWAVALGAILFLQRAIGGA